MINKLDKQDKYYFVKALMLVTGSLGTLISTAQFLYYLQLEMYFFTYYNLALAITPSLVYLNHLRNGNIHQTINLFSSIVFFVAVFMIISVNSNPENLNFLSITFVVLFFILPNKKALIYTGFLVSLNISVFALSFIYPSITIATVEMHVVSIVSSIFLILLLIVYERRYAKNIMRINEEIEKNKEKDKQLLMSSKQAQMGELLSMIAHQWRQPLAAISSVNASIQTKIQLGKINLNEEDKAYLVKSTDKLDNYIKDLSQIINDFRNFYKPTGSFEKAILKDICQNSLSMIKQSLIEKKIEIIEEYNNEEDVELLIGELIHVVLNLLTNAQDVLLEKGVEKPYVKIKVDGKTLTVCDNGGGISGNIIDKVFEPYFSTKYEKNGTGLGLYMSKTIIEEHHNGKLLVENTDDGACFTIKLG